MPIHKPLIGAHTSVAGGLHLAVQRSIEINATTMQIFTKSNKQWQAKSLEEEEIALFKNAIKNSPLEKPVVHAAYLINIGSSNQETAAKSVHALTTELQRCNQLDIPYLVVHPGAHTGAGEEICLKQISKNLDTVLDKDHGKTMILLETMAGQGSTICYTFEHFKEIFALTNNRDRLGVCFDTCHTFTAGYDFTTLKGYETTMEQFDGLIGLKKLHAIHINGSKTPCGSRVDRHEELGKGHIPLEAFKFFMQDSALMHIPKILETPNPLYYAQEIALLKKLV